MGEYNRKVAVIGSTGSIGKQALQVLAGLKDRFAVAALAAGSNEALLNEQAALFGVKTTALAHRDGPGALCDMAAHPGIDDVLIAVSGAAGLAVSMAAARAGKRILLANKETLVCAGPLFLAEAAKNGATVLPIDSEHSAIYQCLAGAGQNKPQKLILTCSGGPFRGWSRERLASVTFADTQNHPTWNMGWKITLDSATLFNKGLELLEAVALFGVEQAQVEVVVHPQSVIHSAVEFADGSVIAQLGWPDMRLPIQYALTYPVRTECTALQPFSLLEAGPLTFEKPDETAFPCLALGREAANIGGVAGAVYNAAGEATAELFRQGRIGFLQIAELVEKALSHTPKCELTLENIIQADQETREKLGFRRRAE
ncbi:MAG: 1-deoxy-D-xylulose-5-phosphate reductoisomerase [Clostridia bacterium]|nr:1-deoxy-D-xylulose-5-phosphate reductoisomerase [Clostridia bacterium]